MAMCMVVAVPVYAADHVKDFLAHKTHEIPDLLWDEQTKQTTFASRLYGSFSNNEELFQALSERETPELNR